MSNNIPNYINLINSFMSGNISANEFEKEYLELFKNDEKLIDCSNEVYEILDTLFYAVDSYCSDPDLQNQLADSLNSDQLLDAAKNALHRLSHI